MSILFPVSILSLINLSYPCFFLTSKTTQIPQFILEENLTSAKIVVAQPRRLAATGVAGRVAEERGEIRPGVASVGYVVRGDTAVCNDTRLLFCTFGILLRQLQSDRALDSISHIVIDEVHERNLDGDILMGLLRESLKANPHLNVILMSATLDADRFAAYWGDSPRIHIPGRTFPVQDYMLEDVLQRTRYNPPKKKRKQSRFHQSNDKPSSRKSTPWDDSEISDREEDDEEEEAIEGDEDTVPEQVTANDLVGGVSLEERVKRVDQESVDYNLLGKLVKHVVESKDMGDGSILIFLQGVGEIMQAKTIIAKITQGVSPPLLLLPLHGSLQPKDQLAVFRKVSGQVKVILSTNVSSDGSFAPTAKITH
jgi:ATP-dependent RNA helicase DHX57